MRVLPSTPSLETATPRESAIFSKGKRKSVLIADPDESSRAVLAATLCERYDVYEASDGVAAAELAKVLPRPALVICEVELPGLDGFRLVQLFKRDSTMRDVPFVFLSDRSSSADVTRGMYAGARRYIVKPFVPATVFTIVNQIVGT